MNLNNSDEEDEKNNWLLKGEYFYVHGAESHEYRQYPSMESEDDYKLKSDLIHLYQTNK